MNQASAAFARQVSERCIIDARDVPRFEADRCYSVESRLRDCELTVRAPMYSLKTVLSGTETYEFDGGTRKIASGEFLLVAPGTAYTAQVRGRWETVGRCYYFTEPAAEPIAEVLGLFESDRAPPVFEFARLGHCDVTAAGDAYRLVPTLRAWARRWLEEQARVDRVDPLTRARVLRGLERARWVMDDAFDERWTVKCLAKIAHQSPGAFARNFARVYEITPARYLERRRLGHAAARLGDSNPVLTELALDCGYPDLPTFSKAFRRRFGVPPSRWKRTRQDSTSGGEDRQE